MAIHESGQMYLETIYILRQTKSFVRAIDVGEQMGYTKPSVSRALSILKKDGYVEVDGEGAITLTSKGLAIAETMYTRHTVLTEMLKGLGVDEKTAAEDACRIEHVIRARRREHAPESHDAGELHWPRHYHGRRAEVTPLPPFPPGKGVAFPRFTECLSPRQHNQR